MAADAPAGRITKKASSSRGRPDRKQALADVFARLTSHDAAMAAAASAYVAMRQAALTESSARALVDDTVHWHAWCVARTCSWLPGSADDLADYLGSCAATDAIATIKRRLWSIGVLHQAAGVTDPTGSAAVKFRLKGLAKQKGTRQGQALGMTAKVRDKLLRCFDKAAATRDPVAHGAAVRDAAITDLAYDTGARRSELVAFNVSDITRTEAGDGAIRVEKSKTDQTGEGHLRYVSAEALARLDKWLALAGITDGALFRPIDSRFKDQLVLSVNNRHGGRLDAGDVNRIWKRAALAAGMKVSEVEGLSGHSARVGGTQDLVANGATIPEIMQARDWKSPQMVARYAEHLNVMDGAVAKLSRKQRRSPKV